jgi:hypothetical protein
VFPHAGVQRSVDCRDCQDGNAELHHGPNRPGCRRSCDSGHTQRTGRRTGLALFSVLAGGFGGRDYHPSQSRGDFVRTPSPSQVAECCAACAGRSFASRPAAELTLSTRRLSFFTDGHQLVLLFGYGNTFQNRASTPTGWTR